MLSVAEIRRWVAESASGSGAPGVERAVIACWVIYLVILADRPRARGMGNGVNPWASNPLPAGAANHRHWWKLKTHFITRLILRPPRSLPPPILHGLSSLRHLLFVRRAISRVLFSPPLHPPPSTHHIPPLWRRLVRADRLNMRPAIPDGTNIIKVRLHAKPVKYRRPPFSPLPSTLFALPDLSVLANGLSILCSFFLFAGNLNRLVPN